MSNKNNASNNKQKNSLVSKFFNKFGKLSIVIIVTAVFVVSAAVAFVFGLVPQIRDNQSKVTNLQTELTQQNESIERNEAILNGDGEAYYDYVYDSLRSADFGPMGETSY